MLNFHDQTLWFRAGFAARQNFQDSEPPICYDYVERDHWRRGYQAAEIFIVGDEDDDGDLL